MSYGEKYFRILEEGKRRSGNSNLTVVAVSKNHPFETLWQAYKEGIRQFGENRIQEGIEKINRFRSAFSILPENPVLSRNSENEFDSEKNQNEFSDLCFHHIGPLQSGNIRKLLGSFQYCHGVGSKSALKDLINKSEKNQLNIDFFLQVNLTEEDTKNGFTRTECMEVLDSNQLDSSLRARFAGFMTMGPSDGDPQKTKKVFRELREIRDAHAPQKKLSMGMSGDYQIALDEGSDIIRIGTAIFGERIYE
jgi:pyridoxal phosphate enzyme (YggS family)